MHRFLCISCSTSTTVRNSSAGAQTQHGHSCIHSQQIRIVYTRGNDPDENKVKSSSLWRAACFCVGVELKHREWRDRCPQGVWLQWVTASSIWLSLHISFRPVCSHSLLLTGSCTSSVVTYIKCACAQQPQSAARTVTSLKCSTGLKERNQHRSCSWTQTHTKVFAFWDAKIIIMLNLHFVWKNISCDLVMLLLYTDRHLFT